MIDGASTASTSTPREFVSPDLTPGKKFSYTLAATVVRNGKTMTSQKQIAVHAGEETYDALAFAAAATAKK